MPPSATAAPAEPLADTILGLLSGAEFAGQVAQLIAPRVIRAGLLDDPVVADAVGRRIAPTVLQVGGAAMRKSRERVGLLRDRPH